MAEALFIAETLRLRPVVAADARTLFAWVNDAHVRAVSFAGGEVTWQQHIVWLGSQLADGVEAWLWLAETPAGSPVGQIRFQGEQHQAVMSISIDRQYRRRGYGSWLMAAGCQRLFESSSLEQIVAFVKPDNIASQTALRRVGFTQHDLIVCRGQPAQAWSKTRPSRG